MYNTTIAVTGASGHIGNVVCRMLCEKGYRVKALVHSEGKSLESLPLEIIKGDVLNKEDVLTLIDGCNIVIHCAAIITIHGDPTGIVFKTNTEGPKNVLEVCLEKGVTKLIHISSTHAVMEQPVSEPFSESRPYKTKVGPAYDYSKAVGEQLILEGAKNTALEVTVLRPSSVVGPYDFKPSEMGKALMDFYNQRIPALPEGGYDFVDVRDVAHSILAAIDNGKNGEIYLVTGKYYTLRELVKAIQNVTGKKMPQQVIPYTILKLLLPLISIYSSLTGAAPLFTRESIDALKNGHPKMNPSKASVQLGHKVRPIEETIQDFYTWHFNGFASFESNTKDL